MLAPLARAWLIISPLVLIALGESMSLAQPAPYDLPFTVQRIVVPPQRVAKELEKVQQGTLQSMPLHEFDARLERVRQSLQIRDQKPRLLRAHYTAELVDRSLSNGSGQWTIFHSKLADSILPIDSLSLAVQKPKWEQGGDALLGEFDGESLGLLVKQSGQQQVLFDWSARGVNTSEGLSFALRVPSCPITAFEFTLPADLWLAVPKGPALVSGPFPAASSSKRLWKIQMTGQSQLDFHLRKVADPKSAVRTIFALTRTTQELAGNRLTHDFEFDVDILHGSVRELILEGDADLHPADVTLKTGDIKSWRWEELAGKKPPKGKQAVNQSGQLTIEFRQPIQGKVTGLKVRAQASLPSAGVWTSPGLRIRDSLSRGETLKIQVHPDLQPGKWHNGSFQLTNISVDADGSQTITLADFPGDPASARRPSFVVNAGGVDVHTHETNQWRIDGRGASLSAEWNYHILRGQLQQLAVLLPPKSLGYQVESIELQPPEYLRGWHVSANELTVELKQAIGVAKTATLKIAMRSPFRGPAGGVRNLTFPAIAPLDSNKRQGGVAVMVDRIFQSQLVSGSTPLDRLSDSGPGSPSDEASYRFTFRDQPIGAVLRLVPQPVQVQLRGRQSVVLSDEGTAVRLRWEVEPLVGAPEFLDFRCSDRLFSSWRVKADDEAMRIHRWERLPLDDALPHLLHLGHASALNAAMLEHALPGGTLWRFHLAEPLRKKSHFTLEATLPADLPVDECRRIALALPSVNPWTMIGGILAAEHLPTRSQVRASSIPLLLPVQPLNVDHDISIESPRASIVKADSRGIRILGRQPAKLGQTPVHSLTYLGVQPSGRAANLQIWTHSYPSAFAANELCDQAQLTTAMTMGGRLTHHLQFRLWHWRDRSCTIRFDADLEIVGAKIQGRWLDRLEVHKNAEGVSIVLPIDQTVPVVACEIVARAQAERGWIPGVIHVAAPRINWPLPPIDFHSRVRLSNGLVPLQQERLRRVGVPDQLPHRTGSAYWLRYAWTWGRSWLWHSPAGHDPEKRERQRQTLLNAETQLREGNRKELVLARALERLALHHLKEDVPLVVDRLALRSLGLVPTTELPPAALSPQATAPFWESIGLIHVPCPTGALLTSPRRLEEFGIADSSDLDDAVQQALLHGRDASGAFSLAITWAGATGPGDQRFNETMESGGGELHGDDFTAWEGLAGDPFHSMYVVDAATGRRIGWIGAILLGVLLWRANRVCTPLACLRVYLLLLPLGILTSIWLSAAPFELFALPAFVVALGGFVWFLFTFGLPPRVDESRKGSTMLKPAVSAAIMGVVILALPFGAAQPPAARTYSVLVIGEAKTMALVPLELVAKLDELENPSSLATRNAIITGAKYVGKLKDQTAKFSATFDVYSPRDNAELIMPLAKIQLQEGVLLDGVPAFPTVHKDGYALKIRDKGIHQLRLLSFSVRSAPAGEFLDLDFGIPKLTQSEITIEFPPSVQAVQCLHGTGEEHFRTLPSGAKEWRGQVGYVKSVHLRWAGKSATESFKAVDIKEMHYWDLRPGSLSLSSVLNYSIGKGSLSQLTLAVPDPLHVRTVEVQMGPVSPTPALPISIKNWHIFGKGAQRRLVVDLAQPMASHISLTIEFIPQLAFQTKPLLLPLPAPTQGSTSLGQVGYRLQASEPRTQNLSVENIPTADFAAAWKQLTNQAIVVSRAYTFQRKALQSGLDLVMQPVDRRTQADIVWKIEPHFADLSANFTLTSADSMIVQEFSVPATFTLASVTGQEVGRWQLRDQLLQVWFRAPCKKAEVAIAGWHVLDQAGAVKAKRKFDVPCVYALNTTLAASTLRIEPGPSLVATVNRVSQLRPIAPGPLRFDILKTPYEAEVWLDDQPAAAEAQTLTKVHATEQGIEIWCGIRLTTDRGQLPAFTLQVENWPGGTLLLDAPGATVQPLKDSAPQHRAWKVTHPSGLPRNAYVVLRGYVSADKRAIVALPTLKLDKLPIRTQWLLWKDVEMVAVGSGKKIYDAAAGAEKLPFAIFETTSPRSSSWKQAKYVGQANAIVANPSVVPKARIVGSTEQLVLTSPQHWQHEADFWIHVEEPTTMRIRFPAALEVLTVFVDQELRCSASQPGNEYLLPLSAASEAQVVRLRFSYPDKLNPLENPRLEFPVLGVNPAPGGARIVWVPAGLTLPMKDWRVQPTLIERLLQEASRHARLTQSLAQASARPTTHDQSVHLLDQQKQFYLRMRQCEYLLSLLKNANHDFDTASLRVRMNHVRAENAKTAQELGYDRARGMGEKSKITTAASLLGSHPDAAGLPVLISAGSSNVPLQLIEQQTAPVKRTQSEIVLLFAVALLVFSFFRHALVILHGLVPETVSIALLAGSWLFGWGFFGIAMIGLMIALRVVWLVRIVKARFTRSSSQPSLS